MREIKFRAWNSKVKEMCTPFIWVNEHNLPCNQHTWTPDVPLMQFTGKIDDQGHEVYEGDIYWNEDDDFQASVVEYNEKDACFIVRYQDGLTDEFYTLEYDNYHRVGNIYENPELLGQ